MLCLEYTKRHRESKRIDLYVLHKRFFYYHRFGGNKQEDPVKKCLYVEISKSKQKRRITDGNIIQIIKGDQPEGTSVHLITHFIE